MHTLHHIGVDVGSKTLKAARLGHRGQLLQATFSNDAAGHRKLIAWATSMGSVRSMPIRQ